MTKLVDRVRMTDAEYRANLNGLNIFFGAILGFVLAGTETLAPLPFSALLTMTAGVVISILYISSSERRIAYAVMTMILIAAMHRWMLPLLPQGSQLPQNLQPTLAVWALMTIFVEFLPRQRNSQSVVEAAE